MPLELTDADSSTCIDHAKWGIDYGDVCDIYLAGMRAGIERSAKAAEAMPTTDIARFAQGAGNISALTAKQCAAAIRSLLD